VWQVRHPAGPGNTRLRRVPAAVLMEYFREIRLQIDRVAMVRAPFVRHPVNAAGCVAHEQPSFETTLLRSAGFRRSRVQNVSSNTVAFGETSIRGDGECYFAIRHGDPARFGRRVGPKRGRGDDGISALGRRQLGVS